MPATITQKHRPASISTPLGPDVVVLKSLKGREQVGRLFRYELELISEDYDLDFDKIIGRNVTISLDVGNGDTRYFNGFVSRFVQTAPAGGYARYQATVVPWLWFLTRTADCRIFQTKTIPDILEEVFKGHGFDKYERRLSGQYTPWDYCVQYRETDFNFVSRLMEQEGIYYYFKHKDGEHTLVLADSAAAHDDYPGYEKIAFRPLNQTSADIEFIRDWVIDKELQTAVYAHTDFNFEKPKTNLQSSSNISRQHAAADFEMFDYPGEYGVPGDGDDYAKIRIQEIQARHETLHGETDARGVCAGYTFTLTDYERKDQNRKYLVLAANHTIQMDLFEARGKDEGALYECSFSTIDATVPFRAPRITPKPIVQGPQTAIVVGPSGEEIYTDPDGYGRVKVQFHWDRYGKADENSSCWVRVSQAWAGKNWGAMYVPRVGQEVIVEFLEGDPDRPIITGRVYNAAVMPPYALPDFKTMSTLKSLSSKGGGGFNEIRFEDKKGSEQVFIHGERNLDIRIKNDAFETVSNNHHLVVEKDKFEHIENNRHETVDADHMEQVGKDRHLNVAGKEAKAVGGSLSLTVTGDVIEVFKGKHSEQVTSDYYVKADNIVIEAMTNVTIKVGQSYIAIEASGISIGTSGTLDLQAQVQAEIQAPQVAVSGDAMVTIKGGQVMIN